MKHRHLNHQGFTLAAIDDFIDRGTDDDWAELREAALRDPSVLEKVLRVCSERLARGRDDPEFFSREQYEQWKGWAEGVRRGER